MSTFYEVEYNNRTRVPDHASLFDGWARDAAAYRATRGASRSIAYGQSARNRIDMFEAASDPNDALVVFIHGGYWQAMDPSYFSHVARGLNERGIDVALPGYDLCPHISMADMIVQLQDAIRELARMGRRLVVSGHSAGAHLAACMMATDWSALDASLPRDLIQAGYVVSGVFDLTPLVETSINGPLRLDRDGATSVSPLFWPPPIRGSLDAMVGEHESAEFFRQSETLAATWRAAGLETRFQIVANANHFTAIAPLSDPLSPMTNRLVELARG